MPVVLLHGFPYDVRAYDVVAPLLAAKGCRVITPYLRGYGPTRFLSAATLLVLRLSMEREGRVFEDPGAMLLQRPMRTIGAGMAEWQTQRT